MTLYRPRFRVKFNTRTHQSTRLRFHDLFSDINVRFRLILPLALALGAVPVAAQNSPQMSPAAAFPQWRSFIGANPLGIPFDIVAVELETTLAPAATIGFSGSYNDIDNTVYKTVDGKVKYYPAEVAMRGFAVGMSVGWTKFNGNYNNCTYDPVTGFCNPTPESSLSAGTLGVLIDYNWTQGPSQRFVVGAGIGAKRILASQEKREPVGLERAYVTGRFVIGLLF
jgi:hypothetical protein